MSEAYPNATADDEVAQIWVFDLGDGPTFGNALERHREPGLRIGVVHFRGLQEGGDSCPCPAAAVAAREQRGLARDGLTPDLPLDDVGINLNAAVDEEAFKSFGRRWLPVRARPKRPGYGP